MPSAARGLATGCVSVMILRMALIYKPTTPKQAVPTRRECPSWSLKERVEKDSPTSGFGCEPERVVGAWRWCSVQQYKRSDTTGAA